MSEVMKKIITDVLVSLYQPFGFAVVLSILFMVLYLYVEELGWKGVCVKWCHAFKNNSMFRCVFALSFYSAMILFRTLLNRNLWLNPLSNVMGGWGLYNDKGVLTTEAVENLMLFIPFTVLLMCVVKDKLLRKHLGLKWILWKSTTVVFLCSVMIEFLQLFLRVGTFQLSDLFYNTLGGFIGGFIYWCGCQIKIIKNKGSRL